MSLNEFFKSNHLNNLLIVLATLVVLVLVFAAGIFIGHEKTRFSQTWGEHYYRNIMGPGGRGMMELGRPQFNAHSGFGQILKIEDNNIIVKGPNDVEKTIVVTDKTEIRKFNQVLKITDLRVDENIVVIGAPNSQGQIEAKLIRVMPNPPIDRVFFNGNGSGTSTNEF